MLGADVPFAPLLHATVECFYTYEYYGKKKEYYGETKVLRNKNTGNTEKYALGIWRNTEEYEQWRAEECKANRADAPFAPLLQATVLRHPVIYNFNFFNSLQN